MGNLEEFLKKPSPQRKGLIGLIILCFVLMSRCGKSPTTTTTSTPEPTKPAERTIKKRPDCLYVPESKIPVGMSHNEYKKKVKQETGAKCLFFTGE